MSFKRDDFRGFGGLKPLLVLDADPHHGYPSFVKHPKYESCGSNNVICTVPQENHHIYIYRWYV